MSSTHRPESPSSPRPVRTRATARVLVLSDDNRILLLADSDALLPDLRFWITPGGGIEPGEDVLATAVRELHEETGLVLDGRDFRGPIAQRTVVHAFSDVIVDQSEVFFLVRVPRYEVSTAGHTDDELRTISEWRWFRREDLEGLDEAVWPSDILRLWDVAEQWTVGDPPVELSGGEESTVRDDRPDRAQTQRS